MAGGRIQLKQVIIRDEICKYVIDFNKTIIDKINVDVKIYSNQSVIADLIEQKNLLEKENELLKQSDYAQLSQEDILIYNKAFEKGYTVYYDFMKKKSLEKKERKNKIIKNITNCISSTLQFLL